MALRCSLVSERKIKRKKDCIGTRKKEKIIV